MATLVTGEVDPAIWTGKLDLGLTALFIVILGTITTCSLLLYAGIMAILSVFPRLDYKLAALLVTLPSIVFIYAEDLQVIFNLILLFVGFLAGPYWAVVMADFFLLRKGKIDVKDCYLAHGKYAYTNGINPIAFGTQICGMILWMYLGGWLSEVESLTFSSGITLFNYISATLPSMVFSAIVYVIAIKYIFKNTAMVLNAYR